LRKEELHIYSALADATSTTTFVSERITDWTGYSPVDFYENDKLWGKCIHPEDRQLAVETFINAYTNRKEYIFEYRMVHKETGQIYHLRDHGVPIRDDDGQIIRFDGILTDISRRKQAEEALLESEERYRLVNENIPVAVYSALPDEHSTSLFLSGRVEELTGYTGEQFLADSTLWERIVHPDDIGRVWEAIEAHRLKKEPLDVEYRIITKDNAIKWIRDRAIPALDEQNQLVRIDGYMEDITERKQAESRTQKMLSILIKRTISLMLTKLC
jgi:PAS domain S-box-containing protein